MFEVLRSFLLFAAAIFVVLNGPLWVSARVRILTTTSEAPGWLYQGILWLSRLTGVTMLGAWAWDATWALKPALLLWLVVAIGLFFLLDGPWRIITGARFLKRGSEAPTWGPAVAMWFSRMVGVVALLSGLVSGIYIGWL